MKRIGIDLGGTKTEIIVLGEKQKELFRKRIPTVQAEGYDRILSDITALYDEAKAITGDRGPYLGMGIPGVISSSTGLVKNANTTCLIGRPLKKDLERKIGRKLEIQNDANCFALAEARSGRGRGKRIVFGVILGTGCGGGIVIDGRVHPGLQGIAGEWGHMQINPAGPECYCGKKGCVETYISGGGIQNLYKTETGVFKTVEKIIGDYRAGESKASHIIEVFFENFGIALSNLIGILDPDIVILGGGLSNIEELYTKGIDEVRKRIFSDGLETPLVKNSLGDSAGVLGAALTGIAP